MIIDVPDDATAKLLAVTLDSEGKSYIRIRLATGGWQFKIL